MFAGPLSLLLLSRPVMALETGDKPSGSTCTKGTVKYYALDTPNHECAEACLGTAIQRSEFWVITGGQGKEAGNLTTPCATLGFHKFARTDKLGEGPLELDLDKYLPDANGSAALVEMAPTPKSKCALKCTAEAIAAYWACAGVCIAKLAPNSCITAGCLATTAAVDTACLKKCPQDGPEQQAVIV